jgi:hypothetical protein
MVWRCAGVRVKAAALRTLLYFSQCGRGGDGGAGVLQPHLVTPSPQGAELKGEADRTVLRGNSITALLHSGSEPPEFLAMGHVSGRRY